jgi:hypothetical protein
MKSSTTRDADIRTASNRSLSPLLDEINDDDNAPDSAVTR